MGMKRRLDQREGRRVKTYRWPVCKKPLTRDEFEAALGILGEREKHFKHEEGVLRETSKCAVSGQDYENARHRGGRVWAKRLSNGYRRCGSRATRWGQLPLFG
jgi:hypothetical protein